MSRLLGALLISLWVAALCGEGAAADVGRLRFLTAIYRDEKGGGMRQPEGVACDGTSTLIVADTGNGRLLRFTVGDQDVRPSGEMQSPQISVPIRLQLSSKGEVLALDGKERRVGRFDPNGAFKGYLRPEGVPAPTEIVARSLKLDREGHIYLLDVHAARVLVLDPTGKYERLLPFPKKYGFFSDLAVSSTGTIYLLDSVDAAVWAAQRAATEFSPFVKNLRAHLSFPTSVTLDSRGILYIVDQNGAGVVLVGQDGSVLGRQLAMGWNEGQLYYPSQICINARGQAFIADRGNSRVQVFTIAK